jgi:hypothetical protein
MFWHLFGMATIGKPALALGIIASAYGAGTALVTSEYHTPSAPAHETVRPQTTAKPTPAAVSPTTTLSFEALLSECVARYKRGATNTKDACDRAIEKSGLSADAFVAKYRSLLVPPATKAEKPAPTTAPRTTKTAVPTMVSTTGSFEALLSECVARYKRGATNTKDACDRAIAASGLSGDAFLAKYRSLLVPATKTETPKPTTTPKPTAAPKLNTADPKVRECLAKYEALKTLKTSDPETFEAALSTFSQSCKTVLGVRG